jgi:hypothetical protein
LRVLFVGLPILVGLVVMSIVHWRSEPVAPGMRTSELLATGELATAEVLDVRTAGGFMDPRPMVGFKLLVTPSAGDPFQLVVVQPVQRDKIRRVGRGTLVDIRLSADRTAAAVVLPH